MLGCDLINFDIKTLRIICSCKIGNNTNDTSSNEIEISNDDKKSTIITNLKSNIIFSKSSNIKVIRCSSIIFNKKLIFKNYGFYIMLLMTFLNILFFLSR